MQEYLSVGFDDCFFSPIVPYCSHTNGAIAKFRGQLVLRTLSQDFLKDSDLRAF